MKNLIKLKKIEGNLRGPNESKKNEEKEEKIEKEKKRKIIHQSGKSAIHKKKNQIKINRVKSMNGWR